MYESNFGGTNIYQPMNYLINKYLQGYHPSDIKISKKLFLLTDGEVDNPEMVIDLASKNADNVKIHSFGIGSDCSIQLVSEVARVGRGTASFVDES